MCKFDLFKVEKFISEGLINEARVYLVKAHEKGNVEATLKLANFVWKYGARCTNTALRLLKPFIKDKSISSDVRDRAIFEMALIYDRKGDMQNSINLFKTLANKGDVRSMHKLGEIYEMDMYQDTFAIHWYLDATEHDYAPSAKSLSNLYFRTDWDNFMEGYREDVDPYILKADSNCKDFILLKERILRDEIYRQIIPWHLHIMEAHYKHWQYVVDKCENANVKHWEIDESLSDRIRHQYRIAFLRHYLTDVLKEIIFKFVI